MKKTQKKNNKKSKRSIRRTTKRQIKRRKMRGGDYDSHIPYNSNAVMNVKQDGMFIGISQDLYNDEYKQSDVEKEL